MPLQEDGVNYTFTWDVGIGEQDAVYDITLKGYTSKEDRTGVLLGTSTVDKNTPGSYQESEEKLECLNLKTKRGPGIIRE